MPSFWKKYSKAILIVSAILLLFLFFIFNSGGSSSSRSPAGSNMITLLVIGLVLGGLITFLSLKLYLKQSKTVVKESSHTIIESIRKVFKIVCAEGQLNELYNFEETKKIFGFIPSTKRALVIIEAKVLIGFDFEKCDWEVDESSQKIKLITFPSPEILSIETDYKYYNFDEGIFNMLNREDLTRIQANGKKQVEIAAINSHLPKIAADQMRTILMEVVQSKNWQLEDSYKITEDNKTKLSLSQPGILS